MRSFTLFVFRDIKLEKACHSFPKHTTLFAQWQEDDVKLKGRLTLTQSSDPTSKNGIFMMRIKKPQYLLMKFAQITTYITLLFFLVRKMLYVFTWIKKLQLLFPTVWFIFP